MHQPSLGNIAFLQQDDVDLPRNNRRDYHYDDMLWQTTGHLDKTECIIPFDKPRGVLI